MKQRKCDKLAIVDRFQAISPIFKLSNIAMDITYKLTTGTTVRARSYDPLKYSDLLLFLTIIAFCRPHAEEGIPAHLQKMMELKWDYNEQGATISVTWRELARICGYKWHGKLKEILKESLYRLFGISFRTKTKQGQDSAWHLISFYDSDNEKVKISINPRLAETLRLNNPEIYKFVAFNLEIMNKLSSNAFMLMFYLTTRIDIGKKEIIKLETIKKHIWNEPAQTQYIDKNRTKAIRAAFHELNKTGIWSISEKNKGMITAIHKTYKKWKSIMALEYDKEFVQRLRLIPLEEARVFYSYHKEDDPVGVRIDNIIDLLIHRERKNFSEAIEKATLNYKNPPKSHDEAHRRVLILRQLNAIGAEHYRISAQKQGSSIAKWNDKEFFTKHEIIENNRLWLSKNIDGYNIYITPQETNDAIYILVDDADISSLENDGFKPSLTVQTSQQSFQAVFVVNRKYMDRGIYISLFNMLNKQHGDEEINGLRHAFRLVGYKNMKPGRQEFVVKIVETSTGECSKISRMVDEIAGKEIIGIPQVQDYTDKFVRCPVERKLVNFAQGYQKWVHGKFQYGRFDHSRADIMLARRLREIGATDNEIFTILLDMPMHTNPDPVRYATRTTVHSRPAPVSQGRQQELQEASPGM